MRVENFSSGYLRTDMKVVPYEDGPAMESEAYSYINRQFYARTDVPPIFRLGLDGEPYFQVSAEFSIPADRIGIPSEWMSDNLLEDEYRSMPVYILKPDFAYLLKESERLEREFNPPHEE